MADRGRVATTIALVVAAIAGVSYLPRRSAEPTSESKTQAPAKPVVGAVRKQEAKKPEQEPSASCEQIAKRLQRFYQDQEHVRLPGACFTPPGSVAQGQPSAQNPSLKFVIAIVADPVQTHLSLLFDRSVEAVQQAAQDLNYSYDGSWFPWNQTDKNFETLSDQEQAAQLTAQLQEQPGIMVFRRGIDAKQVEDAYHGGLIVFLVSEQPTGGINDTQFEHALQWMDALRPGPSSEPLSIIGPTFSGSLPSLARELKAATTQNYPKGVLIYSGTISSEESVKWFRKFLNPDSKPTTGLLAGEVLKFRTFYEGDTLMTDRFLCYLQHEGYDLGHVAILSEDQTAFGHASAPGSHVGSPAHCQHASPAPAEKRSSEPTEDVGQNTGKRTEPAPIYLYYPRDIATLRSAYEQQSIFSAGKQQNNAPSSTLRGDLSEPASSQHDTVRSYAGQLTPLTQESVLFGITSILESKNVEFVILRSTNSLDQLFLSEFLHRSYPSGRVVIDGSDLLFRRGIQGASLRGVMLLSPYPLVSWTHDAIPPVHGTRESSYRVFPEDLTEGTYIAARALFEFPGSSGPVPISDYGPPKWARSEKNEDADNKRPATWVSVVGHRQFWAVAVLNDNTEREGDGTQAKYGPTDESLLDPEEPEPESSSTQGGWFAPLQQWLNKKGAILPGEMTGVLFFCAAFSLWHLYCCAKGSIIRPPRARAFFAPVPRVQHTLLIFLGSLVLGLLATTIAFTLVQGAQVLRPLWAAWSAFGILLMVLSGFLGCVKNYQLPIVRGWRARAETRTIERWQRRMQGRRWEWFVIGLTQYVRFSARRLRRIHVPRRTRSDDSNQIRLVLRICRWRKLCQWAWLPTLVALAVVRHFWLSHHLTIANSIPTYWRGVFLRSGVSGLLPQLLLLAGVYAWFWFSLHGLSLFGDDRPKLPRVEDLPAINLPIETEGGLPGLGQRNLKVFRMFSQQGAAENIERNAIPLSPEYATTVLGFFVLAFVVLWIALGEPSLRSLGDRHFGMLVFYGVSVCIALLMADAWQLLQTWSQLRQLLVFLDRLRLRRTLSGLQVFAGKSAWKVGGNVLEERYRLISRQLESARNLQNTLRNLPAGTMEEVRREAAIARLTELEKQSMRFVEWYVDLLNDEITDESKLYDIRHLKDFQEELAATAGYVMTQLILPAWREEKQSLILAQEIPGKGEADSDRPAMAGEDYVRAAEEFFVLPYFGFIQNTLGRMRTITFSILSLFVAATLGVSCYPFDPLPVIGAIFLILFLMIGAVIIFVFAEMARDATLSHMTHTTPGELNAEFWIKVVTFGLGPLIGLLTTLFPSMTDFVVSVLQPGAEAFK